jgi:hypothetical protein
MNRRQAKIEARLSRNPHGRTLRRLHWRAEGGNRSPWEPLRTFRARIISRQEHEHERREQNKISRELRRQNVVSVVQSIATRITDAFLRRHQSR